MSRPDGGPAFPSHVSMGEVAQQGMSLRDYFAIHATERDIAAHDCTDEVPAVVRSREAARYAFADAMLAAREGDA